MDLGAAPPFKLGDRRHVHQLPNVPRATVQYQKVEGGEIVRDGDFVDLDKLAKDSRPGPRSGSHDVGALRFVLLGLRSGRCMP